MKPQLPLVSSVSLIRTLSFLTGLALSVGAAFAGSSRQIIPMDAGWKFSLAAPAGAENAGFDDSAWRTVNLPHDWSIEGPFSATNKTGGAGAFLPGGIAWYRRDFSLPANSLGRRVFIEFDGVMQNSDVWINGHLLGHRPSGYVGFSYELTDAGLNYGSGALNSLVVRADTSEQPASRWYSGGGIYRHVRLIVTDPVHIERDGVYITTPTATATQAVVRVQTTITNESQLPAMVLLKTSLLGPNGKRFVMGHSVCSIPAQVAMTVTQQIALAKPDLWNLDDPKLYQATSTIYSAKDALDETTTTFGIRDAHFDAKTGFWLNGKNFKLYGVGLHQDGGAFGVAVPMAVWEERLKALRAMGANAIRTAHNPPAPEFLDLCDRMGFLVMDEFFDCWEVGKNRYDYHLFFDEWSKIDAADTVRRDRNHPCVVLYSIGNEIHDTPKPELAIPIARGLVGVCHENDPSRAVTQALFRPNVSGDYTNGLADLLDVVGTNYRDNELLEAQRAKPERKIVGTEQRHDRQTWLWLRDNPSHSGQFIWTGVDYLGETRRFPLIGHASGLLDRTGVEKPMAFERASWWSDQPMVRIARRTAPDDRMPNDPGYGGEELHTQVQFADWTPRNTAAHDETVEAYSNCEEVELFLNGQSLGVKKINADASPRVWKVPFAPGTLKAIARNGNKVVALDELRTAGKPVRIQLDTENAKIGTSWDDVAIVRARILDANGILVPRADDLVTFTLKGPGLIAAVDNADTASTASFQATERHAFQGKCVVFVKASGGKITLNASAPGLKSSSVSIKGVK